jgi:hypothetical protein
VTDCPDGPVLQPAGNFLDCGGKRAEGGMNWNLILIMVADLLVLLIVGGVFYLAIAAAQFFLGGAP